MADRMRWLWMPFWSSSVPIGVGQNARVNLRTLLDAAQARDVRQFTVTRMIFRFNGSNDSGALSTWQVGVRFENENVAVGTVSPIADLTADWLYWEEVATEVLVHTN